MHGFLQALAQQRWDDHRYYHHSRINQTLHLISALSFLAAYALLFSHPVAAALLGWIVAMWVRQIGHFFFEPKGYDQVNDLSHAQKEAVKIGYNLRRKIALLAIWAATPLALHLDPSFFGTLVPQVDVAGFVHNLGTLWIGLGVGALVFRVAQLACQRDLRTGLVWVTKILTDPLHDIKLYHKAPIFLLRGQLLDPMTHTRSR